MKKSLFIGLLSIFIMLSGCVKETTETGSTEQENKTEETNSITFKTDELVDGFQRAEFDKFNSYASDNGLGGTKLYIDGTFEKISNDAELYAVLKDDTHSWIINFGTESQMRLSDLKPFEGKNVRVFCVFTGYSNLFQLPTFFCLKFTLVDTGECHHMIEFVDTLKECYKGYEDTAVSFGKEMSAGSVSTDQLSTPTVAPTQEPIQYNSPKISLSEYNQLYDGISYDESIKIIGSSGTVLSESNIGGISTIMYSWDGDGIIGANANGLFQNGKLISKAQYGLK